MCKKLVTMKSWTSIGGETFKKIDGTEGKWRVTNRWQAFC
jgi:hypothetical protein